MWWTRLLVSCEEGEEEPGARRRARRRLDLLRDTRRSRTSHRSKPKSLEIDSGIVAAAFHLQKHLSVFLLSFDVIFELGFGHFGGYYWLT